MKTIDHEPNFVTEHLPEAVDAHAVAYRVNMMAAAIDRLLLRTANLEKQVAHLERLIVAHKTVIMKLRRDL